MISVGRKPPCGPNPFRDSLRRLLQTLPTKVSVRRLLGQALAKLLPQIAAQQGAQFGRRKDGDGFAFDGEELLLAELREGA
jgi:hypothetical protein